MKTKTLWFAFYCFIILAVLVVALLLSGVSNVHASPDSATANSSISVNLNCDNSYTLPLNSTLTFDEGFYSCSETVSITLTTAYGQSTNSAKYENNSFSATEEGKYILNFNVNGTTKNKINISVIKEDKLSKTTYEFGDQLDLTDFDKTASIQMIGKGFVNNIATTAGTTEIISTKVLKFASIITSYSVNIIPKISILDSTDPSSHPRDEIYVSWFDSSFAINIENTNDQKLEFFISAYSSDPNLEFEIISNILVIYTPLSVGYSTTFSITVSVEGVSVTSNYTMYVIE